MRQVYYLVLLFQSSNNKVACVLNWLNYMPFETIYDEMNQIFFIKMPAAGLFNILYKY